MTIISLLYFIGSLLSGFILIKQIAQFNRLFRLLVGPGFGLIFTTLVNLLIGLLIGFSVLSIILALAITVTVAGFAFLRNRVVSPRKSKIGLKTYLQLLPYHFSSHWPLVIILIIIGVISGYVFFFKVLTPAPSGLLTGGGGLYADTAMHAAFTSALVEQGLPPTNPLFAGKLLVYPFLVNFFSASLVKLGMNLRFAFILPQLVYLVGFITLFYAVGIKIIQTRHAEFISASSKLQTPSRIHFGILKQSMKQVQGMVQYDKEQTRNANWTIFFALLIFFFGWGLGWTQFVIQGVQTGDWKIAKEYTNNLPGYQMHNVLTGIIYPARSLLPGLLIGLLILYLLFEMSSTKSVNKYQIVTIAITLATLPLWHTHTFLFMFVAVGVWLLFDPALAGENFSISNFFKVTSLRQLADRRVKMIAVIFSLTALLFIPIFLYFKQQVSTTTFFKLIPGWTKDGQSNLLLFWLRNTGLVIPLAAFGFWKLQRNIRIWFVPSILMFVIANLVQFQPWDWDNIKLFSWVFLFFALLAGYGLTKLTSGIYSSSVVEKFPVIFRKIVLIIFAVPILFSLTASGFLSIALNLAQEYTIYDKNGIAVAEWIKEHTAPSDVFLIDPWPNHPVSGLSGRSVYIGYPGQLWVHGLDYYKREQQVKDILAGKTEVLAQTEVPINYIVTTSNLKVKLMHTPRLAVLYENSGFSVFQVK